MKPQRARMVHSLLMAYDLYRHMDVYEPRPATQEDLISFHTKEYVDYLKSAIPGVIDVC